MIKLTPLPKNIESVTDIANVVTELPKDKRFLFRGQTVNKPPLPRFAREVHERKLSSENIYKLEKQMLERFRIESLPFLQGLPQPQTDFDWLSIAQHHGLPTRLLDWTANALAALWFAVSPHSHEKTDEGVIWILEVEPDNVKKPDPSENPFELRRTYIFQPFHIDRRITAQAGWFSIHRYAEERGKFYALDRIKIYRPHLRRHVVPSSRFAGLRDELRILGITEATLFPDLSGLCAEIQAETLRTFRAPTTI